MALGSAPRGSYVAIQRPRADVLGCLPDWVVEAMWENCLISSLDLLFLSPHWKKAVLSCGVSLSPRFIYPQKIPTRTHPGVTSSASSSARDLLLLAATSQAEVEL